MKRWGLTTAAVVIFLAWVQPVWADDYLKDTVEFDKAYIPALAMTNQDKRPPAIKAMKILDQAWAKYKGLYYDYKKSDARWRGDFDQVGRLIAEAGEISASDKALIEAHETLEGVRLTFMETRRRYDIDYLIDHFTEFHEYMEEVTLTAKGKTPETLSDDDLDEIRQNLTQAVQAYEKVQRYPFDPAMFGFNGEKTAQYKNFVQREADSLADLEKALGGGDKAEIIKKSMAIKPYFIKQFFLFGDFDRIKAGN
ncbi:MAG: hypothetical protein KKB20_26885 [Proteobacteria bacterium]|nr:hypothetical protein [Pseudomonadota bacterium]